MTKQEIVNALTTLLGSLDTIKETATNREFYDAARPDLRTVHRGLITLRDTPDE